MNLSEFQPDTELVTVKRRKEEPFTFHVRGLNILDLTAIVKAHFPDLGALGELYNKAGGATMTEASMVRLCHQLIGNAPGLVAHIIARATDNPDAVNGAARLPFMAQVDALQKIGRLTFEEAGSLKKMMADLQDALNMDSKDDQSPS